MISNWRSPRAVQVGIFLASGALSSAFFINFCAWIFQCGCHSLWAGAAATCNIHVAGVKHCPWCEHNPIPAYVSILASQLAVSFWPLSWSWMSRLAAAVIAFPLVGAIVAAIYGLSTGYWK